MLFHRKQAVRKKTYNADEVIPVIKSSICTGEQVAGFQNIKTGTIEDVMLISCPADLQRFRQEYGIEGDIKKIY